MKQLIPLFFLFLFSNHIISQEFAPLEAIWHYTLRDEVPEHMYYLEVKVTKDTVILGRDCKEIDAGQLCGYPEGLQYVSTQNDSVLLFDKDLQEFQLIYAFNTPQGGSWTFPLFGGDGYTDTIIVSVDDVSTIEVNSHILNVQHVTYWGKDYFEFGFDSVFVGYSEIVEIIGDLKFLFYFPTHLSVVCDFLISDGLRCYEDNFIGHYETGIAQSCTYTNVGVNEPIVNKLGIYPNPTNNEIFFHPLTGKINSIELIDPFGQWVRKYDTQEEINLEGLMNGMYTLKIINDRKEYYIEKVIKSGQY